MEAVSKIWVTQQLISCFEKIGLIPLVQDGVKSWTLVYGGAEPQGSMYYLTE
jgi:hypothetical protein